MTLYGPKSSPSSPALIFKPGSGLTGPVVFDTWAGLITQLAALRVVANNNGRYVIQFDDSITSPCVIPAGGPYDMTNCELESAIDNIGPGQSRVSIVIAEGATFTKLRRLGRAIVITNLATATSPCSDFADNEMIRLADGAVIFNQGTAPLFDATALGGSGDVIYVRLLNSSFGVLGITGGAPVIDMGALATLQVQARGSAFGNFAAGIPAGATINFEPHDAGSQAAATQPGVLGTHAIDNQGISRYQLQPDAAFPTVPATSGITAKLGGLVLADVSGGAFAVTLPVIVATTAANSAGYPIAVKEISGTAGLTVARGGSNTIDGSTSSIAVPAGGALLLASDGVSNWMILGKYDPAA